VKSGGEVIAKGSGKQLVHQRSAETTPVLSHANSGCAEGSSYTLPATVGMTVAMELSDECCRSTA